MIFGGTPILRETPNIGTLAAANPPYLSVGFLSPRVSIENGRVPRTGLRDVRGARFLAGDLESNVVLASDQVQKQILILGRRW